MLQKHDYMNIITLNKTVSTDMFLMGFEQFI